MSSRRRGSGHPSAVSDRIFDLRPGEQLFEDLHLIFLARGNEQLVYTAAEYPGVAIKIHWYDTKRVLEGLGVEAGAHWLDGTIGEASRKVMLAHADQTDLRLTALRALFGSGHSIPRSCGPIDVAFPGRILRALGYPAVIDPRAQYLIPAPVVVQEWKSLDDGSILATGLAPPDQLSATDVERAGRKWLERTLPGGFEPELMTRLSPSSTVPEFIAATQDRPELARAARAFVDGARAFTRITGELLALRGRDNLFFDADGNFHLIDTLGRPARENSIGKIQDKLRWIRDTGRPLPPKTGALAHYVTSIAALNAVADAVGTEPYWTMPKELQPYPWQTYYACIDWQTDAIPTGHLRSDQLHEPDLPAAEETAAERLRDHPPEPGRSPEPGRRSGSGRALGTGRSSGLPR